MISGNKTITMKKQILSLTILALLFLMTLPSALNAEEKPDSVAAPAESKIKLAYIYGAQDSVTLTATLLVNYGMNVFALEYAGVDFFATGESSRAIGKAVTSQEGIAVLTVSSVGLPSDKEGLITYVAKFPGNAKYPAAEASFTAKPANLKLFFSIEDSIKILKVTATQKDQKGQVVPLAKETINIYVPRLFSLLKIGEISLDETGSGTLEFPKEIVGDTLGNLTVMARLEEHDIFGMVQGKNTINWGVPKQYYKAEVPSRELWTPIAPMWMIITLIIMLLGVWAHYVYAVYELVMIKRLSNKENQKF
jgi:hypothetical protein